MSGMAWQEMRARGFEKSGMVGKEMRRCATSGVRRGSKSAVKARAQRLRVAVAVAREDVPLAGVLRYHARRTAVNAGR